MPKKKPQHGGAREAAGRPAIYRDRGKISVVMEQSLLDALDRRASAEGTSRSQVVAAALRKLLKIR
jgi:hypothetical protein